MAECSEIEAGGEIRTIKDPTARKALVYSTDETDTGKKWIDGKPIYRRVFFSATNWANGTKVGTISNVGIVIKATSLVCATNGQWFENFTNESSFLYADATVDSSNGDVTVRRSGIFASSNPSTVIVEYTKTTD